MSAPIEHSFTERVPAGDNRPRRVCDHCEFIDYHNPKVVVGAVCTWEDRFLLCRRAIEPRKGFWTIPAGFLEQDETTEAGACRETLEEAGARIEINALLAIYSIPHISQVQLVYRASLLDDTIDAGEESLEVGLLRWEDIPWDDLAFPNVRWSLEHYREVEGQTSFAPFSRPIDSSGPVSEEAGL